jgi:hypothetical protein
MSNVCNRVITCRVTHVAEGQDSVSLPALRRDFTQGDITGTSLAWHGRA